MRSTSSAFSAETLPFLLRTFETVPWETPAALAISLIVGICPPLIFLCKNYYSI